MLRVWDDETRESGIPGCYDATLSVASDDKRTGNLSGFPYHRAAAFLLAQK